jgi:hypothetical protein
MTERQTAQVPAESTGTPLPAEVKPARKFFAIAGLVFLLLGHPLLFSPQHASQQIMVSQSISVSGAACTPMSGYLHCRVLTIVTHPTSTLTNFPVLVSTSYGGNAQSASCFDHVYTSDSLGTTLIPWEQEHCSPPAGVVDWVLVTPISSSADTLFYVSYDNASITVAQNTGSVGPTHVWDANYQLVAHLVSNSSVTDSTSNANTCTVNGTVSSVTGQISLGTSTNGTAANFVGCGAGVQVAAQALTISGWVKSSTVNVGWVINKNYDGSRVPYGIGNPGSSEPGMSFYDGSWHSTGVVTNYKGDGLFHFVVGTYDGTTLKYFFDGNATPETTLSYSGSTGTGTGVVAIGEYINNSEAWNGSLDEVRVSNSVRVPAWINFEWLTQKTSSTALTVGAEI